MPIIQPYDYCLWGVYERERPVGWLVTEQTDPNSTDLAEEVRVLDLLVPPELRIAALQAGVSCRWRKDVGTMASVQVVAGFSREPRHGVGDHGSSLEAGVRVARSARESLLYVGRGR